MVTFIKLARKRGIIADTVHAVFNILFAAATIFLTIVFDTPWLAILLVLLAKWRVIAVRPRYWWANFLSSLPDLVFGLGVVVLSWGSGQLYQGFLDTGRVLPISAIVIQVILGIIYAIWLIAIKPRHSEAMVGFQALASQFIGLSAIFFVSGQIPRVVALLLVFLVAFSAARQAVGLFEEKSLEFLATIWGLLMMELAYVSLYWSVYYQFTPLIRIPQIAIIATMLATIAHQVYRAWHDDRRVTWDELSYPLIFTVSVTLLILFGFSGIF